MDVNIFQAYNRLLQYADFLRHTVEYIDIKTTSGAADRIRLELLPMEDLPPLQGGLLLNARSERCNDILGTVHVPAERLEDAAYIRQLVRLKFGPRPFKVLPLELLFRSTVDPGVVDSVYDEIGALLSRYDDLIEWRVAGSGSFEISGEEAEDRFETELEYPDKVTK